jgi:hypothetical protein
VQLPGISLSRVDDGSDLRASLPDEALRRLALALPVQRFLIRMDEGNSREWMMAIHAKRA